MKTLIFNGSPRAAGNTTALIDEFMKHLKGEFKIINVYASNIKACIDCRYCQKHSGCSQKDGMQKVYRYIEECDNILIASPIFFTELTGQLLAVASRLQTYFCAGYFRKEIPIRKSKKGGVILAGGGNGTIDKASGTARILLHTMNSKDIAPVVYCANTDTVPSENNTQAMDSAKQLAVFFNGCM